MACLDMYKNPDHKGHYPPMTPRLSFSNDFVESHHTIIKEEKNSKLESSNNSSSDFEFSVTNHSMTAADELFFKGKLLPVKEKTTLRDELLVDDDDDNTVSFVPPLKGGTGALRWKGFLGLKRAHGYGLSKTYGASDRHGTVGAGAEGKMLKLVDEEDDADVDAMSS